MQENFLQQNASELHPTRSSSAPDHSVSESVKYSSNQATSPSFTSEKIISKYKIIGDSLSETEMLFFTVGLPWYYNRNATNSHSLGEKSTCFFRSQLVGVPTEVLECYLEDLEVIPLYDEGAGILNLYNPRLKDRLPFISLGPILGAIIGCMVGCYLFKSAGISFFLVGLFAWSGLLVSLPLSSDPYRRYSFHQILQKEINRRKGVGPGLTCPT